MNSYAFVIRTCKLYFYRSLLLEDLNADGFDDLIVGAPGYSLSNSYQTGRVYIKYGMFK